MGDNNFVRCTKGFVMLNHLDQKLDHHVLRFSQERVTFEIEIISGIIYPITQKDVQLSLVLINKKPIHKILYYIQISREYYEQPKYSNINNCIRHRLVQVWIWIPANTLTFQQSKKNICVKKNTNIYIYEVKHETKQIKRK